jgi:dihydrofolate reductase
MKTQYYTASSLDGFIATEDDSLDWLFPLGDINETGYPAFIADVGALAMGSATYEWMLRHAQTVASETGSAWPYDQPTWVFSNRTLPAMPGADLHFVRGDVRPVHAAMRAAAGGRMSGSSGVAILPGSSTMPACWTRSSSRSAPSRSARESHCFRDG